MNHEASNPLLATQRPPFHLPDFERILPQHFEEATPLVLDEALASLQAITASSAPATYANTVLPMERSGARLRWIRMVFISIVGANANKDLLDLEGEINRAWTIYEDALLLDIHLYQRLIRLLDEDSLSSNQCDVVRALLKRSRHAGGGQPEEILDEVRELNAELAIQSSEFVGATLKENQALAVEVGVDELSGLHEQERQACIDAGCRAGLPRGRALVELRAPLLHPYLSAIHSSDVRKRIFDASESRGSQNREYTTAEIIRRIAELRARKAQLLGYRHYASWALAAGTAGDVNAIDALVLPIGRAAAAAVAEQRAAVAREVGHVVPAWDLKFYLKGQAVSRRNQATHQAATLGEVVHDGLFKVAEAVHGLVIHPSATRSWHKDCRVFDVLDRKGHAVGTYLLDPFERPGKRPGARMHALADRGAALSQLPIACNTFDLPKAGDWDTAMVHGRQIVTMFHEFGHALHCLCSNSELSSLAGTNAPRDFVECPSQVYEMWAREFLADRELEAPTEQGPVDHYATAEHVAAVVIDQAWHRLGVGEAMEIADIDQFEHNAIASAGMDPTQIHPRYKSAFFTHIFVYDYAAKYYSYIWSEMLASEVTDWIEAARTPSERTTRAQIFAKEFMEPGALVNLQATYERASGRRLGSEPLLRRRGLPASTLKDAGRG